MEDEEILEMAKYCLNCKTRPCTKGCPMNTNIPEFINEIKSNNLENAYKILIENNIFSHICSIVCPQEQQCEGNCTRGIKSSPVKIGKLENFVNKWAIENKINFKYENENQNKSDKVAIIGSGPAGLSCAKELAIRGVKVTVFEQEEKLGGILRYGIPDFRLEKTIVDELIEKILNLGVEYKTNIKFGQDINIEELKLQGYKAIFLGIGAENPTIYNLADENLEQIYTSENFLKSYNNKKYIENLGITVVIGGGNVAIDCSRVAKKMGAKKVYILYRRNKEKMPARDTEIEDSLNDEVELMYLTKVIKANGEKGKLIEIECIKTKLEDDKVIEIPNSEFCMKVDSIVFAIGSIPNKKLLFNMNLELDEKGLIKINENGETNIRGIFAGGDVTNNRISVCKAISAGRKVAIQIIKYIDRK